MIKLVFLPIRLLVFLLIKVPLRFLRIQWNAIWHGPYGVRKIELKRKNLGKPGLVCPQCEGSGEVLKTRQFHQMSQYMGKLGRMKCPMCGGSGRI